MAKNMPGSIPSATLGLLGDIFNKVAAGSFTHRELECFAKRQNPFEIKMDQANQLEGWCGLIKELFGIEIDPSSVTVPEQQPGFDRLIVVPKGLTLNRIIEVCREKFENVWTYSDNLNESVTENDRTNTETYAIWVRERVEADEELKNLSANQLKEQEVPGVTLMERLLHELKYFSETRQHLDVANVTLCSGSRYSDGDVPHVGWDADDRELCVNACNPAYRLDDLRTRAVVS